MLHSGSVLKLAKHLFPVAIVQPAAAVVLEEDIEGWPGNSEYPAPTAPRVHEI